MRRDETTRNFMTSTLLLSIFIYTSGFNLISHVHILSLSTISDNNFNDSDKFTKSLVFCRIERLFSHAHTENAMPWTVCIWKSAYMYAHPYSFSYVRLIVFRSVLLFFIVSQSCYWSSILFGADVERLRNPTSYHSEARCRVSVEISTTLQPWL